MILSALLSWFIAYLLPVLLVLSIIAIFAHQPGTAFRMLAIHIALGISIILSQYFIYQTHREFPWNIYLPSAALFIVIAIGAATLLGRFGLLYVLSSLIQQLTLISIYYYLSGSLSFWLIVLLLVPIYSVSHLLQTKHWRIKIPGTLAWGTVALILFAWRGDVLLNASVHAILGSIFIYLGIMYPATGFTIRRVRNNTSAKLARSNSL